MDNILQDIVEGKYQIQPDISIALDGGTISFVVKDDSGVAHELYLDRRLNSETKNTFYKNSYPGKEGSIQLGKNDALVAKINAAINSEGDKR